MAPDLKNVLERFEKTISENERSGCTSGSYLTHVASRKAAPPPASKRSSTSSSRRSSRAHSPESKVPTDVTVETATTVNSAFSEDPFFSMRTSRHSQTLPEDPFEDDDDDDDHSGFDDNDGFEGSFGDFDFEDDDFGGDGSDFGHGSFGSSQQLRPKMPSTTSRWQQSAMKQSSSRKVVVEEDDGFSLVQDDNASVFSRGSHMSRGSACSSKNFCLKKSARDTVPINAGGVRIRERRPDTSGMVRRVKSQIQETAHPSDLVRRASMRRTSMSNSSVASTGEGGETHPRASRTRRVTAEGRREKRQQRRPEVGGGTQHSADGGSATSGTARRASVRAGS